MSDLSQELKNRFESNYKICKNVARWKSAIYVESLELHKLDPEQRERKLYSEYQLSFQKIDAFSRKEYLDFGPSETRHFNTFFSHCIFDYCDEETQLFNGLYISEKHKQLTHHYKKSKFRLPPFSFKGFLKNKYNADFYEFNQKPPRTSKEDYFKMKTWQILRKTDCVNLLLEKLIERFNKEADTPDSIKIHARSELLLLKELQQANQYTTGEFIDKFIQLRAIAPASLPENETEFHQLFCQFLQGHDFSYTLTPQMLRSALKQVRSDKLPPVPLCNWALIKYKNWLTCILKGKRCVKDPVEFSCEQLFLKTFEEGDAESKRYIDELKEKYPKGSVSEEKYKTILISEVNKLRLKFNSLNYTDYYPFLEIKETAKSYFINNCFLDIDMENQTCELRQAIFIKKTLHFLMGELFLIDERLIKPFQNKTGLQKQFADLITIMVPTPDLMNQLWMISKKTLRAFSAGKPLLFIADDLKDSLRILFNKAWKNLNHLLDSQPGNLTAIYAIKQIGDLELRALTEQDNDLNLNEYFDKVQKLFKVRLQCVKEMRNFNSFNNDIRSQETGLQMFNPEDNFIWAFNDNIINDDRRLAAMNYLKKIGAIPEETTIAHFSSKFDKKNGTVPIEWLGSQGDFATFIKELNTIKGPDFAPYNQHLMIASKCFVQKGGIPFDPQKLRNSKPTMLEQKFIKAAGKFK